MSDTTARYGENVYMALGQTESGRYLVVLFIHKINNEALILSARDMGDFDLPEVEFEVELPSKSTVFIEPILLAKLQSIANTRQITREELVNEWLKEKVAEAA